MELIVFDLDGTLLNAQSQLSAYTRDTLQMLSDEGIAYTLATGRSYHAARSLLTDTRFDLPHIYTNGVVVWHPGEQRLSLENALSLEEVDHVLHAVFKGGVAPFISSVEADGAHVVYHFPIKHDCEAKLLSEFSAWPDVRLAPASEITGGASIVSITLLAEAALIDQVVADIADEPDLVIYSGPAIEGQGLKWADVHHHRASKGSAIKDLREHLGLSKVICFGDGENDLSMFAGADECYAPANANDIVKAQATAVIGHHDEDGIARYLRQRFHLGE